MCYDDVTMKRTMRLYARLSTASRPPRSRTEPSPSSSPSSSPRLRRPTRRPLHRRLVTPVYRAFLSPRLHAALKDVAREKRVRKLRLRVRAALLRHSINPRLERDAFFLPERVLLGRERVLRERVEGAAVDASRRPRPRRSNAW
eukprot:31194-Pelagococcus_subviridis.AAC.29